MNPRLQVALAVAVLFAIAAVIVALVSAGSDDDEAGPDTPLSEVFDGARLPEGVRAPDFRLRDQDGQPVSMRDLRGEVVIVTFLYTNCEDTCPLQAQVVKGALAELGEDVPALAIAVDPPRDTPASARRFLIEQRVAGLRFVLGSRRELQPVWRGYAIRPQSVREEHTGRFVLVDRRGYQRIGFPLDKATPEGLAHDVEVLRAQ